MSAVSADQRRPPIVADKNVDYFQCAERAAPSVACFVSSKSPSTAHKKRRRGDPLPFDSAANLRTREGRVDALILSSRMAQSGAIMHANLRRLRRALEYALLLRYEARELLRRSSALEREARTIRDEANRLLLDRVAASALAAFGWRAEFLGSQRSCARGVQTFG